MVKMYSFLECNLYSLEKLKHQGVLWYQFCIKILKITKHLIQIGVSPEFEIALYTIVFLCSGQKTQLEFAGMKFGIQCFKMERDGSQILATLFTTKDSENQKDLRHSKALKD